MLHWCSINALNYIISLHLYYQKSTMNPSHNQIEEVQLVYFQFLNFYCFSSSFCEDYAQKNFAILSNYDVISSIIELQRHRISKKRKIK